MTVNYFWVGVAVLQVGATAQYAVQGQSKLALVTVLIALANVVFATITEGGASP